jgi:glycosyltransferase involved in cell wall biosynthesis
MKIVYHHRTRATDAQRIHILEMVRAFRKLGHEVEIVSLVDTERPQDPAKEAGEAGWKKLLRRIPFTAEAVQLGYNCVGIPLLLAKILAWRPDFIYERYSLFNFTGVVAARLTGRPLILEVNSPFALEEKAHNDIRAVRLAAWAERMVCRAASRVIVVTGALRNIMIGMGVDAAHLVVMPNGIDPEHMRGGEASGLRERLGLGGKVVIGFVGWFRKWHGLESLLRAFHRSGLAGRASLLLIGDGPAMPELREYVAKHGIGDAVVFTGALRHEDVPPYLNAIDIAVQPAANEYCCPMKILEYMGLSKPLVAPRQPNIEEIVRDGVEAELFTPGDEADLARALARVAADPQLRRTMGENALQAIYDRGFLWTRNAEQVVKMAAPQSR